MKTCPHCGASIASMAEQCPACRQYVGERQPGKSDDLIDWPGVDEGAPPSVAAYFWLGAVIWVIGATVAVGGGSSDDGTSGSAVAVVVGGLMVTCGSLMLLIAAIGVGVAIGLRRHHDWLASTEQ